MHAITDHAMTDAEAAVRSYLEAARLGLRPHLRKAVQALIAASPAGPARDAWVMRTLPRLLAAHPRAGRLPQDLFDGLIWPSLKNAALKGDVQAWLWLDLHQPLSVSQHEELGLEGGYPCLMRAWQLDPIHRPTQERLLAAILRWFDHVTHEWPVGLVGVGDLAELVELRADAALARHLCEELGCATEIMPQLNSFVAKLESAERGEVLLSPR